MSGILVALLALAPITNNAPLNEEEPVVAEYFAITDNMEGQHAKVTYVCEDINEEGKYKVGSVVTLTVNPTIFYDLKEKPTANVDLTQLPDNDKVFSFTMPSYDVNITYTITLNNYIEDLKSNQYIGWIITWVIDSGFLTALIIVFAKYRKYKAMTSQEISKVIQDTAIKEITCAVQKLNDTQLKTIIESIDVINANMDVLQKCFILAQDKSPEGRAALMEYLEKHIVKQPQASEEVKEAVVEQKAQIQEDIKKNEEIIKKVEDDYQPVE